MSVEIPLFPLGTVLFPHMPMRLHIFEERYRQLMRDCTERGIGFGIVGIRAGVDFRGAALPYQIGTLARLRVVEELDDGCYNLVVSGASRFRIGALHGERHPYLLAAVDYLEDVTGDPERLIGLAAKVEAAFRRYATSLADLSNDDAQALELPTDPELLSYVVAAGLQVEMPHQQRLLETDSAEQRLEACLRLLRREHVLLDQLLGRPASTPTPISPN